METTSPDTTVTTTPEEARQRFNNHGTGAVLCFVLTALGIYRCWESFDQDGPDFWFNLGITVLFLCLSVRCVSICNKMFALAGETESDD